MLFHITHLRGFPPPRVRRDGCLSLRGLDVFPVSFSPSCPLSLSAFISLWWILWWICRRWSGSVVSKCLTKEQIAGYFLVTFWSLCQDGVSGVELRARASGGVFIRLCGSGKGYACLCGVACALLYMFITPLSLHGHRCVCVCTRISAGLCFQPSGLPLHKWCTAALLAQS